MRKHFSGLERALSAGALVALAGCSLDVFGGDGGRVRMIVAPEGASALMNIALDSAAVLDHDDDDDDKPRGAWWFQTANVTLSSILVRSNEGELVDLDVELPITLDVVKIDGGKSIQLPDGILPVGDYDQVVINITAIRAVAHDGTIVTLEPPGGGWTAVIPVCPFEVVQGDVATVGLALNVRSSFLRLGNWWSFQPRFRSLNDRDCDAS